MATKPTGLNYITSNRGKIEFAELPNISFTVQQVSVPPMVLPSAKSPNPFVDRPIFGDKVEYSPLSLTFLVMEDLENYLEVHDWIRGLGAPLDKSEHRKRKITFSDATLTIFNSHNNSKIIYTFIDTFPVELSGLDFNEEIMETTPLKASATFEYMRYDVEVKRT